MRRLDSAAKSDAAECCSASSVQIVPLSQRLETHESIFIRTLFVSHRRLSEHRLTLKWRPPARTPQNANGSLGWPRRTRPLVRCVCLTPVPVSHPVPRCPLSGCPRPLCAPASPTLRPSRCLRAGSGAVRWCAERMKRVRRRPVQASRMRRPVLRTSLRCVAGDGARAQRGGWWLMAAAWARAAVSLHVC